MGYSDSNREEGVSPSRTKTCRLTGLGYTPIKCSANRDVPGRRKHIRRIPMIDPVYSARNRNLEPVPIYLEPCLPFAGIVVPRPRSTVGSICLLDRSRGIWRQRLCRAVHESERGQEKKSVGLQHDTQVSSFLTKSGRDLVHTRRQ